MSFRIAVVLSYLHRLPNSLFILSRSFRRQLAMEEIMGRGRDKVQIKNDLDYDYPIG
jgi:hypothetical protein